MRATPEFEQLIQDYSRLMAAAIRKVCGRRHQTLIPDVQQEVYLALWKRLQVGKGIDYPTSYLYKMALTTALAVIRKHAPETPMGESSYEPAADQGDWGLLPAERSRLLTQVLAQLEPDQRRALQAYLVGLNHVEVAQLYSWSESVARHRIYRGIETLKNKVGRGHEQRAASG